MLLFDFDALCKRPQIAFIFSKKQAVFSVIFALFRAWLIG